MLLNLQIKNFILIEQLKLDWHTGFTVITGESGSGKSMILSAIAAICGNRLNHSTGSIVKDGADKATITASFISENALVQKLLEEHDLINPDDDLSIICKRIIMPDNKSKAYVNDNLVSLTILKQITDELLNFNTQHTHIHLMNENTQRNLLDDYAGLNSEINQLAQVHSKLMDVKKKITTFQQESQHNAIQQDYLREKIHACTGLEFSATEYADIELEHKQLTNADTVQQELSNIYNLLENNDEMQEYLKQIYASVEKLENLLPNGKYLAQYADNIASNIQELQTTVQQDLHKQDNNESRLQDIENIISKVYEVTNRYKISQPDIKDLLPKWQEQLQQYEDINMDHLLLTQKQLDAEYHDLAQQISNTRQSSALILSDQISKIMPQVSLKGSFVIQIIPQPMSANGIDEIKFMVNLNSDSQRLQPISDSISGGELSRLSLVIYTTLKQQYNTIIFDEIDVGISGSTASNVGHMLFNIAHEDGAQKQVICITHQAQTASFADNHILVARNNGVNVDYLQIEHRSRELARIISGVDITDTSLQHAKELIASSHSIKTKNE